MTSQSDGILTFGNARLHLTGNPNDSLGHPFTGLALLSVISTHIASTLGPGDTPERT